MNARMSPDRVERMLREAYARTEHLEQVPPPEFAVLPSGGRRISPAVAAGVSVAAIVLGVLGAQVLSGNRTQTGTDAPVPATSGIPTASDARQVYTATGLILGYTNTEAKLCTTGMTASPANPQCDGPIVSPWDWAALGITGNGPKAGDYTVVGTWDGTSLTLTRPPVPAASAPNIAADLPKCDRPAPGWTISDSSRVSDDDMAAAQAAAQELATFGGLWIETTTDVAVPLLHIAVTGDGTEASKAMRKVWGGPMCITSATRTWASLNAIQAAVGAERADIVESATGLNHVTIRVLIDEGGALQGKLDQRFGQGVVRVISILSPVASK